MIKILKTTNILKDIQLTMSNIFIYEPIGVLDFNSMSVGGIDFQNWRMSRQRYGHLEKDPAILDDDFFYDEKEEDVNPITENDDSDDEPWIYIFFFFIIKEIII